MTIALAPGVLASLAANPSCTKTTQDTGDACKIGSGEADVLGGAPIPLTAYLAPPPANAADDHIVQAYAAQIPKTHGAPKHHDAAVERLAG